MRESLGAIVALALGAAPARADNLSIGVDPPTCISGDGSATFKVLVKNQSAAPATILAAGPSASGTCADYAVTSVESPIAAGDTGTIVVTVTAPGDATCVLDLDVAVDGATAPHAVRLDARACMSEPPTLDAGSIDLACTLNDAGDIVRPVPMPTVTVANTGPVGGIVTISPRAGAAGCDGYTFAGDLPVSFAVPAGLGAASFLGVATGVPLARGCAFDTSFAPFMAPALVGDAVQTPVFVTQRGCSAYDYASLVEDGQPVDAVDVGNIPPTIFPSLEVSNQVAMELPLTLSLPVGDPFSFVAPDPACQGATCTLTVPKRSNASAPVRLGALGAQATSVTCTELGAQWTLQGFGFGVAVDPLTGRHELGAAARDPDVGALHTTIPVTSAQPITAVSIAGTNLIGVDLSAPYFLDAEQGEDGSWILSPPQPPEVPVPVVCDPSMAPADATRATATLRLASTQFGGGSKPVLSETPIACDLAACSAPLVADEVLDFGEVQVGAGREAAFALRACAAGLRLTAVAIDAAAPFTPLSTFPQMLGRDTTFRVRFDPVTAGAFDVAATLTVVDAAGATSTVVVKLRGTGVTATSDDASYYACQAGDDGHGAALLVLAATVAVGRRRRRPAAR